VSGLSFRETMHGPVALGATEPEQGAADPSAADLAIHCRIEIDDIDRFVADPQHTGSITGTVDYGPFGTGLPIRRGTFNLFAPGAPGERVMAYLLAFDHDGAPYFLAGRKHAHDDPGFDIWKDTTTLYTVLHEGDGENGPIAGAGVLGLGVEALAKMVATMRPHGGGGLVGDVEPLVKFGKLFLGALWETYGVDKVGGGTA
jgi:cholesterol oxidase